MGYQIKVESYRLRYYDISFKIKLSFYINHLDFLKKGTLVVALNFELTLKYIVSFDKVF
jgi:hypothetical protein